MPMPRVADVVGDTTEEERANEVNNALTNKVEAKEPDVVVEEIPQGGEEGEEETHKKVPLSERLGQLDEEDIEELIRLQAVSDRVQRDAEQRARDLERAEHDRMAREEQARKVSEDQEYLRKLRKIDPVKYNEELDRREALEEAQRNEVKRIRAVTDEFTNRLGTYVEAKVEKSVAEKLRGKDYTRINGRDADLIDGVIAYIDDILKAEREAMRSSMEKELTPVLRKKILTQINGGEEEVPQPANETKPRARGGKVDVNRFQSESEVADAFAKGLAGLPGGISKAEMLTWYKTHGVPRVR